MGFPNIKILTADGIRCCKIGDSGEIFDINTNHPTDDSLLVLPGYVDLHVHFRDFNQCNKETVESGSRAALAGGVCAVADMPNTSPPVADKETYFLRKELFSNHCLCDYLVNFCIFDEFSLSQAASVDPFFIKIYLEETTGSYVLDESLLERVFMLKKPIAMHGEFPYMKKALALSAKYSTPLHICHVSKKEEVELIARYKTPLVTCEATPHHLFLEGDYPVKPPLGNEADRRALWKNLGTIIDIVASDHAPHSLEEKKKGAYGISGVETTVPLMITAMQEGMITPSALYMCMHENQSQILNKMGRHFGLFSGNRIDYTLLSLEKNVIDPRLFQSMAKHSPFEGKTVGARVLETWVRGRKIFSDGVISAKDFGEEV